MRAAIIGTGPGGEGRGGAHSIGYAHAWTYSKCQDINLVAAAANVESHLATFQNEFPQTRGFDDYRSMLKELEPDIVSVCAFPQDRVAMANAAIECGAKAIWLEKPMALSSGEANRILDAAQEANVRVFVNHQRRYGRPFEHAREIALSGELGDLRSIQIAQPFPGVIDFGIHLLDMAIYLGELSSPRTVLAILDRSELGDYKGLQVERNLLASIEFESGKRLVYEAGEIEAQAPVIRVNLADGAVEIYLSPPEGANGILRIIGGNRDAVESPQFDEHFHHGKTDSQLYYDRALADIVRAVQTQSPIRIDATEAVKAIDLMTGIGASAQASKKLSYPMIEDANPWLS